MRTQADRDDDLAIGRELERKDAEIERLKADLATFGKDTVATENRIIDAEFKAQELRTALENARRDILYIAPQRGQRRHTAEAAAERIAAVLNQQSGQGK